MVEYRIDRHSGVATYVQIVQQTKQALRLGLLQAGDKLPTAREVVEATAINPNTVLKAYRELERDGLVEARRGVGTFVRRGLNTTPADSPCARSWTPGPSGPGRPRWTVTTWPRSSPPYSTSTSPRYRTRTAETTGTTATTATTAMAGTTATAGTTSPTGTT